MHRIFVYGTLLPGLCRHYAMQGSRSLGRGTITGLLYDLGPYPAVVHGAGNVRGEVFEVDATVLAVLDEIEAFYPDAPEDKSEYLREEVVVQMDGAEVTLSAWFYRFNQSIAGKHRIEHGDYLRFLDGNQTFR